MEFTEIVKKLKLPQISKFLLSNISLGIWTIAIAFMIYNHCPDHKSPTVAKPFRHLMSHGASPPPSPTTSELEKGGFPPADMVLHFEYGQVYFNLTASTIVFVGLGHAIYTVLVKLFIKNEVDEAKRCEEIREIMKQELSACTEIMKQELSACFGARVGDIRTNVTSTPPDSAATTDFTTTTGTDVAFYRVPAAAATTVSGPRAPNSYAEGHHIGSRSMPTPRFT